jgi:hypothetical protein
MRPTAHSLSVKRSALAGLKERVATNLLSSVVFALIWGQMTYGWVGFENIPFPRNMPTH